MALRSMPHLPPPGKKWNFKRRVGEMKETIWREDSATYNKQRQAMYV